MLLVVAFLAIAGCNETSSVQNQERPINPNSGSPTFVANNRQNFKFETSDSLPPEEDAGYSKQSEWFRFDVTFISDDGKRIVSMDISRDYQDPKRFELTGKYYVFVDQRSDKDLEIVHEVVSYPSRTKVRYDREKHQLIIWQGPNSMVIHGEPKDSNEAKRLISIEQQKEGSSVAQNS